MHLFKYLTKRELEKLRHCLQIILGKDKKSWMFSNWVKAEKCSGFERSGFLELSWRLWFPRFHGLIKCWKSWEHRAVKRLRLKLCSQIDQLFVPQASLWRQHSPEFLLFFPSDKSITCLNSVWTLWTERGQRKQVFPVNKQKKKNVKSFQNTVILGCGKSTIKHYNSYDFFFLNWQLCIGFAKSVFL